MAASSAQDDPGNYGNIVACGNGVVTVRTRRTGADDRQMPRDAINHHVEEGPDDEAHKRAVDQEQGHVVGGAGMELSTTQP